MSPLPPLTDVLATARVVTLPLATRFRGIRTREAVVFEGPEGWTEFSPFVEYDDAEAATWLAAALEFGWHPTPAPARSSVVVNATVPAVAASEVDGVLARFDGCRTAKVKVAEAGQTLADDVARVRAVRAAMGPRGASASMRTAAGTSTRPSAPSTPSPSSTSSTSSSRAPRSRSSPSSGTASAISTSPSPRTRASGRRAIRCASPRGGGRPAGHQGAAARRRARRPRDRRGGGPAGGGVQRARHVGGPVDGTRPGVGAARPGVRLRPGHRGAVHRGRRRLAAVPGRRSPRRGSRDPTTASLDRVEASADRRDWWLQRLTRCYRLMEADLTRG